MDRSVLAFTFWGFVQATTMHGQWTVAYDEPVGLGRAVSTDPTGAILYLGMHHSVGMDVMGTVVTKLDPTGSIVWSRTFFHSDTTYGLEPTTMTGTNDGSVIVSGYTMDAYRMFLVKLDPLGNTVWSKLHPQIGTPGWWSSPNYPSRVIEADNGDIIVTGRAYMGLVQSTTFLSRLDPTGSTLWSLRLILAGYDHAWHVDVAEAKNGELLVLITTELEIPILVRLTAAGLPISATTLRPPGFLTNEELLGVRILPTPNGSQAFISQGRWLHYEHKLYRVDLDTVGTLLSTLEYAWAGPPLGYPHWYVHDVEQMPAGGHVFIARELADPFLYYRTVVTQLNENGSINSSQISTGAPHSFVGHSLAIPTDSTILVAGEMLSSTVITVQGSPWYLNGFLALLDTSNSSVGCSDSRFPLSVDSVGFLSIPQTTSTLAFAPWADHSFLFAQGSGFMDPCSMPVTSSDQDPASAPQVHPNPTSGHCTLSIGEPTDRVLALRVFNSLGAEVLAISNPQMTNGHDVYLDVRGLRPGVYLVAAQLQEGRATTRLVVE